MNWSPTEAFKSLVSERSRGLFSTVVVEEAINVAKNNRKRFVGKRYRKARGHHEVDLGVGAADGEAPV